MKDESIIKSGTEVCFRIVKNICRQEIKSSQMIQIYLKDYTGWNFQNLAVGHSNEVTALTWFSYEKTFGRVAEKNIY